MLTSTILTILPAFLAVTTTSVSATPSHGSFGAVPLNSIGRFEKRIVANATLSDRSSSSLEKRASGYNGRATWYAAGLGACGWVNKPSDKIVALGQVIWDQRNTDGNSNNNGWCNQKICISYGSVSAEATIVDLCPYSGGCSASDGAALDMSESLFQEFAGLGVGVFYMDWTLGGCGGGTSVKVSVTTGSEQSNKGSDTSDSDNQAQADADADAAAKKAADDKAAADKAAADKAAADQAAADKAAQDAANEKALQDKADAAKAAQEAADAAAASSASVEAAAAAAASSKSAAAEEAAASSASAAREERIAYYASISSASEARQDRIASQSQASVASVSSAREEYYASKSEASVASYQSARSSYFSTKSVASAQSVRSERIESVAQASKSAVPVVAAAVDAKSGLAALIGSVAPTAKPSASA